MGKNIALRGFDNSQSRCHEYTVACLDLIGGQYTVRYLVINQECTTLLGSDFLSNHDNACLMDFRTRKITIKGEQYDTSPNSKHAIRNMQSRIKKLQPKSAIKCYPRKTIQITSYQIHNLRLKTKEKHRTRVKHVFLSEFENGQDYQISNAVPNA